jgi:RNA polymerase sigma factor (sigma-70 family)
MMESAATVIRKLRSTLGTAADETADAVLLSRFAKSRDENAFELLVWRHAGMVQRVCRSLLRDHHMAEDASQAVFLALARQAGIVCRRGTVAGWLYRVAWRISNKAARRRRPISNNQLDQVASRDEEPRIDPAISTIIHEELARLPEKYRAPLLLCFFEGLTQTDAARRLGWPVGTVAGRIARAKTWLEGRLTRRGAAIPAAGFLMGCCADPASAFVGATVQAALAFVKDSSSPIVSISVLHMAQGAIHMATLSRLQWAAGIVAACGALTVGGVWAAGQKPVGEAIDVPPARNKPAAAAIEPGSKPEPERKASSTQRQRSLNNLKQIILAFHNYNGAYGYFPANITSKDGKPLLSWRVAILPFLEEDSLYKQFKLDEPWDSEHNLKLLPQMPNVYRVGFEPKEATHTYYQGFAGPGTPFGPGRADGAGGIEGTAGGSPAAGGGSSPPPPSSPAKGLRKPAPLRIAQIADGTSNTLGVVEAGPAVAWSKPADLPYDPKKPLPKLDGPFTNVFHVSMMDGMALALRRDIDPKILRTLIVMDDGLVSPELKTLLARQPAETAEEKATLKERILRNQKLIEESERLMKEHLELLAKKNAGTSDLLQVEEQAEVLKRLVDELKMMNRQLRGEPEAPAKPTKSAK